MVPAGGSDAPRDRAETRGGLHLSVFERAFRLSEGDHRQHREGQERAERALRRVAGVGVGDVRHR